MYNINFKQTKYKITPFIYKHRNSFWIERINIIMDGGHFFSVFFPITHICHTALNHLHCRISYRIILLYTLNLWQWGNCHKTGDHGPPWPTLPCASSQHRVRYNALSSATTRSLHVPVPYSEWSHMVESSFILSFLCP